MRAKSDNIRKEYTKPTIIVVKLQTHITLLTGSSNIQSMRSDYGNAIEDVWY